MRFLSTLSLLGLLIIPLTAEDTVKEGHSHQGHAFNEGPRQAGPLIGNTGEVHFPITTQWEKGQDYFDQGVGQLHGFWYYEAERSFRQILAHDPNCIMAYWGLAMSNWENKKRAKEFMVSGAKLREKASITDQEKAYFDAYAKFFSDKPKDTTKRRKNLLADLENLILDYPEDIEAKAFYVCHHWQFQQKGLKIPSHIALDAILEQVFAKSPHHPAHHYSIHLWDYRRSSEALESAAKLGQTAPAIAHMWHMPGHIYSKQKRYHDAAWHQQASARVDHEHMIKYFLLPDQIHNYAHNNGWLSENFAYLGDAKAAVEMAKSLLANPRHPKINSTKKRSNSVREGYRRLIRALEDFELWEEALTLESQGWLELSSDSHRLDQKRLNLIGRAHFHLGHKEELAIVIQDLGEHLTRKKKEQKEAEEKARQKATKEHKEKDKKEELITKAVKKAGNRFKNDISSLEKDHKLLQGCLAELNGDKEAALASLSDSSSLPAVRRRLILGEQKDAEKHVQSVLKKDQKRTLPLARTIDILFQLGKQEEARKHFDALRKISSQAELTSPPFARLAPIAKEFGYPTDWRLSHQEHADVLPRPHLDTLGPLHWTPPTAPAFSLPDQHGKSFSLAKYQGKPLVLIFYLGAGCLHCTEQLTAVADRYADFQKAELPVLAISTDGVADLKKSQDNYTKGTIPFPIVSDAKKGIFKAYTAHDDFEDQPLHGTFVLDSQGRILWSDISADPFMDLDFLIKEAKRMIRIHQN